MTKMTYTLAGILMLLLLVGACTQTGQQPQQQPPVQTPTTTPPSYTPGTFAEVKFEPQKAVSTIAFKSADELDNFIKANANAGYGYYGGIYGGIRGGGIAIAEAGAPMVKSADVSSQQAPSAGTTQYSETNNQVASVDEADIIKTDGSYIYTISNNNVYIVKAYPGAEAEIASTLKFQDSNPESLFIKGKFLAVFGNYYSADFFKQTSFRPNSGMTFFNIYDISDPSAPKLVK